MTSPFPRPLPAAKPRPLPAAAHAPAGGAAGGSAGAAGGRGRRGLAALAVAGLVLFGGVGGALYIMSGGAAVGGAVPPAPSAPAQAARAAAASASPDTLAAGIGEALKNYQCDVSPGAGGKVLVPSDFGRYSCVIIGKTAQSQVGGGFVAPCVSAPELQDYLDVKHAGDGAADAPSCLPAMLPNREAELRPLGCSKLSYFFSGGRKYLLCN